MVLIPLCGKRVQRWERALNKRFNIGLACQPRAPGFNLNPKARKATWLANDIPLGFGQLWRTLRDSSTKEKLSTPCYSCSPAILIRRWALSSALSMSSGVELSSCSILSWSSIASSILILDTVRNCVPITCRSVIRVRSCRSCSMVRLMSVVASASSSCSFVSKSRSALSCFSFPSPSAPNLSSSSSTGWRLNWVSLQPHSCTWMSCSSRVAMSCCKSFLLLAGSSYCGSRLADQVLGDRR